MLEKREMLLHKKMAAELEKAKDFNRAKNKRAALQCLKKKKLYEQQIEQLQNQQLKLEEQVITLEGSKTTAETFTALKSGAGAMKQLHKETNIDEVDKVRPDLSSKESNPKDLTDDLSPLTPLPPPPPTHSQVMDDINEQTEKMRQVQDALGQPVGYAADLDEDELEEELAALEAEDLEDELDLDAELAAPAPKIAARPQPATAVSAPAMPSAPVGRAPAPKLPSVPGKSSEDEELEALQREMELLGA